MAGAGDLVTQPGVPDAFKHFQDWFNREIEKRDQLNHGLQADLERCKQQNAELQARLDARAAADKISRNVDDNDRADCAPSEHAPVAYSVYSKLRERQEIEYQSLKVAHQAIEQYKSKLRKAKDSVRGWQEYAQKCEERAKAKAAELPIPLVDPLLTPLQRPSAGASDFSSSRPSSAGVDAFIQRIQGGHPRSSSTVKATDAKDNVPLPRSPSKLKSNVMVPSPEQVSERFPSGHNEQEADIRRSAPPRAASGLQTRVSSGLTEDSEQSLHADDMRARSTPAMPSAFRDNMNGRLIARSSETERPPEGSPQAPVEIKSEPNSSPGLPNHDFGLIRAPTFDLDELGSRIDTPRKLKRMQTLLRGSSSLSRSFPPPIGDQTLLNQGWSPSGNHEFQRILKEQPRPLQSISANRNDLPRGQNSGPKKRKHHLSEEVASVIEDGGTVHSRSRPISPSKKMKADNAIQGLLAGNGDSTPIKRALITPKTVTTKPQAHENCEYTNPKAFGASKSDKWEWLTSGAATTPKASITLKPLTTYPKSKERLPSFKAPPPGPLQTPTTVNRRSPRKRATPLRQRSVSDLKPEDFKLNPAAHGGLDLESLAPVRTNAERQHFHSCTNPDCASCGSVLREMARDMPITVGSSLFASTQDELDRSGNPLSDEEKLIKYHLGSTFDLREIRRMSAAERNDLVLTAKTYLMAERYGRHKLRPNARAQSPPGYWDVEMPTTQDLDAQHAETAKRQRELVRERHREAMRKGGKWIFKDE